MPIVEQKTAKYHPNKRNEVIASADVNLQQVQLVDKKGQIRSVIVWQCGPDIFYANSMDGLFDVAQRRKAPEWLVGALTNLPSDRKYSYTGTQKTSSSEKSYLPTDESDAPGFVQG